MITEINIQKSGLTAGEFFTRYDMKRPAWAGGTLIRVMKPYGAESTGSIVEAANSGTVYAIRAWLASFDAPEVAPRTTARTVSATDGVCRCDGEADTHGRCYQCGGYQRHADAGRHF